MIRINLVDNTSSMKHVDFRVVPVTNNKDFACIPDGILPLRAAMRLSHKLKAGRIFGKMGKYLWYRLKEAPVGKHKSTFTNHG
jgi:hypothetical protein